MKIKKISTVLTTYSKEFIDNCLEKGLNLPYVFDNVFFEISLEENMNVVEFMYHSVFENIYLNMPDNHREFDNFKLRLSDAIFFINRATPPILKNRIRDSIKSIDDIISVLETLLIEEGPTLNTNISILKELLMLQPFENTWGNIMNDVYNNPIEKINILRKNNINKNMITMVYTADTDIFNIVNGTQMICITTFMKDSKEVRELMKSDIIKIFACGDIDKYFKGFIYSINITSTNNPVINNIKESYSFLTKNS